MNRKQLWKDSKIIFVLAFPIIIENTLQKLLGTTDTYFAGKWYFRWIMRLILSPLMSDLSGILNKNKNLI